MQADNERLMQQQEKIMKSLSNRHNHQPLVPSLECENMIGEQEFRTKNVETEGGEGNHEEELHNASNHNIPKIQKVELQGEF